MASDRQAKRLHYHTAIVLLTAEAIRTGSIDPSYGATRITEESLEICKLMDVKPIVITSDAETRGSTSPEDDQA